MDLALNNLQWLICHKTQPNATLFSLLIINTWSLINKETIDRNAMKNNLKFNYSATCPK